jgi:hypothetical protein
MAVFSSGSDVSPLNIPIAIKKFFVTKSDPFIAILRL